MGSSPRPEGREAQTKSIDKKTYSNTKKNLIYKIRKKKVSSDKNTHSNVKIFLVKKKRYSDKITYSNCKQWPWQLVSG